MKTTYSLLAALVVRHVAEVRHVRLCSESHTERHPGLAASCADSSQAVAVYRDFNDGLGNHFHTVSTPLLSAESHVSLMSFILSPKKQH
jgi:hypothetical protein